MDVRIKRSVQLRGVAAAAAATGISKTTISRAIRGRRRVSAELRRRLEAVGIHVPTIGAKVACE